MNHYVYMITNLINGKKYIGKRSCQCKIEEDKYMGSGLIFKAALKKYGKANFKKEIIEILTNENKAFERERYWIKYYNAVYSRMFYNIKDGGEGNTREDILRQMSSMTEEKRRIRSKKLSIANKGKNNSMYGKIGKNNPASKPIVMFDYKGNIIKEFECIREANHGNSSAISKVCIEKQGTVYGYLWLFKCDYLDFINNKKFEHWLKNMNSRYVERNKAFNKSSIIYNSEPVYQLDKDSLVLLNKYNSIKDAVMETGIHTGLISRNCKHSCNTAGGYSWIFAKEYNRLCNEELKKLYSHKYKPCSKEVYEKHKKKVICITTEEIFNGIIDAIKHFNLCKGAKIAAVCKGKRKSTGKHPKTGEPLNWMYYDDYLKLKNNLK